MNKTILATLTFTAALISGPSLAQHKMDDMKGMDMPMKKSPDMKATHSTSAIVKKVNPEAGSVTLDHEAINSLNWPAMTMGFKVRDKALFDKLAVGKKVEVELTQEGKDYVVTGVK